MTPVFLSFILSLFVSLTVSLPGDIAKFRKSHDFPLYAPIENGGVQTANEFQMVVPGNIVFSSLATGYDITSVSPLLINNDDVVTVSYSSLTPKSSDWIGAYSPANTDITQTVPVKYGYCDDSAGYLTTGVGSLTFNLTNLRSDVAFYYFSGRYTYKEIYSINITLNAFM